VCVPSARLSCLGAPTRIGCIVGTSQFFCGRTVRRDASLWNQLARSLNGGTYRPRLPPRGDVMNHDSTFANGFRLDFTSVHAVPLIFSMLIQLRAGRIHT
jgi:hypothetical protein